MRHPISMSLVVVGLSLMTACSSSSSSLGSGGGGTSDPGTGGAGAHGGGSVQGGAGQGGASEGGMAQGAGGGGGEPSDRCQDLFDTTPQAHAELHLHDHYTGSELIPLALLIDDCEVGDGSFQRGMISIGQGLDPGQHVVSLRVDDMEGESHTVDLQHGDIHLDALDDALQPKRYGFDTSFLGTPTGWRLLYVNMTGAPVTLSQVLTPETDPSPQPLAVDLAQGQSFEAEPPITAQPGAWIPVAANQQILFEGNLGLPFPCQPGAWTGGAKFIVVMGPGGGATFDVYDPPTC